MLTLDTSIYSRLDWKGKALEAQKKIEQGENLSWYLDFQLDIESLDDSAYLSALQLSAEHFSKTLWPTFPGEIILYKGKLEPIVAEKIVPFLKLIAIYLPEGAHFSLILDTSLISDGVSFFRDTNPVIFEPFTLILEGKWPKVFPLQKGCSTALLLPKKIDFSALLELKNLPFQVISEAKLTQEWEAIRYLIVYSEEITPTLHRKLKGFCITDGEIVTIGKPLGLPGEIPFEEFIKSPDGAEGLQLR